MQSSPRFQPLVEKVCALLPELDGAPITVQLKATLTAHRGRLYSKHARGQPVHAGSDLRKRIIILDRDLRFDSAELQRILIHELFHFAWVRLGNPRRNEYAELVAWEISRGARGELGWSAEYRKAALSSAAVLEPVHRRWREYVCESFCDTAAWRYAAALEHNEFTLSKRYRESRKRWFVKTFGDKRISI